MNKALRLRSAQVALVKAVQSGLLLARRVLPAFVLNKLAGGANKIVSAIATPIGARFEQRSVALSVWQPVFPKSTFAKGLVVLANDALGRGGAERQIVTTLEGLDVRGIDSGLLCLRLHVNKDLDFFIEALANFRGFVRNAMTAADGEAALNAAAAGTVERITAAIAWLPYDVQADVLRFAGEFTTIRPAVVHAWQDATSIAAGYAAWMVGVPRIVLSARSLAPLNFHYLRPYMANAYRELASCRPIIMLNNSEAGARDYVQWLGVAQDRFVVLRNGYAGAMHRPPPERAQNLRLRLNIPNDAPVVGSIIRFSEEKQPLLWVETAVRILSQSPNCHFVIFGTGPMWRATLTAAKRQGLQHRLHCPGTIDNPTEGLSIFNVFLLTSRMEGTPNVILEASLMGVPVVATDAGGTRETIAQGATGYVVEGPDADQLAQRVISILEDPAWAERTKTEGPVFVKKRFGIDRMLDEIVALYCALSA